MSSTLENKKPNEPVWGLFVNPNDNSASDWRIPNEVVNIQRFTDYRNILEEIQELEADLNDIPLDKIDRRLTKSNKLEQKKKDLETFKQEVPRIAQIFEKENLSSSERLKKAQEAFYSGDLKTATIILNEAELDKTQENLLNKKEQVETELESNANEYLIKAKIVSIDFNNLNRMEESIRLYEKSIKSKAIPENLFEYGYFLKFHNHFLEAVIYYNEALEKYKKLAEKNPDAYMPYVAGTLINLAIFYLHSIQNKEKSLDYALEGIMSCLPFLEKSHQFQNYYNTGMQVIQAWGENPQKLIEEYLNRN